MKTGQSRIDDAVDYIFSIGKAELANHVATLASTGNPKAIGKELSLGSRADDSDDPSYGSNTSRRQALRALLLCQRVYFSNLWWTFIGTGGGSSKYNALPAGWKATSLQHWGARPEAEIIQAIYAFSVVTAEVGALVGAADGVPDKTVMHPDLTLTRAKAPFPGQTSCYGSVMSWLFRSGLVSYRWYAQHSGANNEATLRDAFGRAKVIIGPDAPFQLTSAFPNVPRGHIVHLYCAESGGVRWNGHWLVSLGAGRGIGCNNDDTDGTNRVYTTSCSLAAQFVNGYRDDVAGRPGVTWKGIAEVINPLEIPNRI